MTDTQSPLSSPLDNLDGLTSVTDEVAQDLVSQAAAEMGGIAEKPANEVSVPEVKPPEPPKPAVFSSPSLEHQISDADVAKFAGSAGDYALPISPLDDLSSISTKSDGPMPLPASQLPPTQPVTKTDVVRPDVVKTEPVRVEPVKMELGKTDVIRPADTKSLEQKAKDMLNDLGPVAPKPKKRGGAVTKMALAATLVVLMGTAGVLGVKYMNQSKENRSQASGPTYENGNYAWKDDNGNWKSGSKEEYTSWSKTLSEDDDRSDNAKQVINSIQQASCPKLKGSCSCGTYHDDNGCAVCHDDCAAVAKSNIAACGKASCETVTDPFPNKESGCLGGTYACYWGCCGMGSSGSVYKAGYHYLFGPDENGKIIDLTKGEGVTIEQLKSWSVSAAGKLTDLTESQAKILSAWNTVLSKNNKAYSTTKGQIINVLNEDAKKPLVKADGTLTDVGKGCKYDAGTGTFGENSLCRVVEGGYLYIGATRFGTGCFPALGGGGDYCTIITGGGYGSDPIKCADLGLIRCKCSNGVWTVGGGDSCDGLCGGTGNTCESCNPTPNSPTPVPTSEFACLSLLSSSPSASIKIGSPVTFLCASSGGGTTAEFKYTIDGGSAISIPTSTANKLKSDPVTFTKPGSYKVACRVCKADGTTCSDWGIAQ